MKKLLLKYILVATCILLLPVLSKAQETSNNTTWYYNNFETATAGTTASMGAAGVGNASRTSANVTIDASTTSPLAGSTSLRSASLAQVAGIRWDLLGGGTAGTTVDLNANDFEWNFLYRNNSIVTPDDPDVMTAGNNSWRYWLFTNSTYTTNNMQGIYITHCNTPTTTTSSLELRYRYDNGTIAGHFTPLLSAPIANDQKTYIIKVQRLKDGRWTIYKDEYVTGMTTAKTQVSTSTSNTTAGFGTYRYSFLEATQSGTSGRFQWDNFDMYSRYFELATAGANTAANGITQPDYYPNEAVTLLGLKIISRGNYTINQLVLSLAATNSAQFEAYFNGAGSLYRSDDNVYNTSNDALLSAVNFTGTVIQDYNVNDLVASSGNTDGTYSVPGYYFVTGTVKSSPLNYGGATNGTFTLNGITTLTGNNNSSAFTYTNSVSTTTSTTITFAAVGPPTVTGGLTSCGTITTPLTASGVAGATYNWYTANTGGILLQSSTSGTYTPFVASTTTYYVSATTGAGTSSRIPVTVTITPEVSSAINSSTISWPLTGSASLDISGNANHGLRQNTFTTAADRFGVANNAYNFNGTNNYIVATNSYNPTQLIFSISIWFKTTVPGGMLVGFGGNQIDPSNATHNRHLYMGSAGQLYFGIYDTGVRVVNSGTTNYADGLWHHAVGTYGPTNGIQLYVDGVLRSAPAAYSIPQNIVGYWRIGGDNMNWAGSNGNYFNGVLDDFAVYNHELTAAEAADNEMNMFTFSTAYCANNPITIGAPVISGATYSWVDNNNPSVVLSTANPATFPTATTSNYSVTVTLPGCSSVSTVTPYTPQTYTWTGGAGTTNELTAANWNNSSLGISNQAPAFLVGAPESIVIPAGLSVYPQLTNNRYAYSVTIAAGASLSLNNNTLFVGCNIINNNIAASGIVYGPSATGPTNSTITWNGSVANQAYYGSNSTTTPATIGKMTLANTNSTPGTVTIASGKLDIYNLLTVTTGNLAITSPAALTFKSTSSFNYAEIATIPSTYSIKGNINYEVLFQGGAGFRNYRAMGAPIYNNTTTYSTSNGSYVLSDLKRNFIITGQSGTTNGFDASVLNGATIRLYNTATNNYTFVTNLNTAGNVASGDGFYMYYRGNRTPTGTITGADPFGSKTNKVNGAGGNTYAVPEAVTFTYTGIPNQGSIATNFASTDTKFYFISNPYPATLDADAVILSSAYTGTYLYFNISDYFINRYTWIWNPSSGNYAVYDQANNGTSTNGAKRYIVPGQGFFIQADTYPAVGFPFGITATPTVLTITESMKATAVTLTAANAVRLLSTSAPVAEAEPPVIRLKFSKNDIISDEIGLAFNSTAKDSLDSQDAAHMTGDYMNFTTITPDNKYLSIDKRPLTNKKTTIPLFVNVATDSIYTFKKTYLSKMMSNYKVTLYDSLLNNNVEITNNPYAVNIYRGRPETYGGKRFKLIIEQLAAPVTYYDLKGKLTANKKGLLTWKTSEHRYGTLYQLQRSQDKQTFTDIGNIQVGSTDSLKNTFDYTDNDIQKGINYYRLVQTDVFGNKLISETVNVTYNLDAIPAQNGFKLYPNPVIDNFSVISDKTYSGKITLRVYDSGSNLKFTTTVAQLNAYEPVQQYVSQLRQGVYLVEIKDDKNKVLTTLKFVKQ